MSIRSLRGEPLEPRLALSANIPQLSSLPDATAKLYLDFDGHYEAVWGGFRDVTTPAYSRDSNVNSFSALELNSIHEIWARVAEDYSPFNIDVTTIDPGDWDHAKGRALRVAIGGHYTDWYGSASSGVAHYSSFTGPLQSTVYVFSDVFDGRPESVADIISHEAGHAFGLRHQAAYAANGVKTSDYSTGTPPSWSPLMGNSLGSSRSTWHNGPSDLYATSYQYDIDVIANSLNGFGLRADDHGNSLAQATRLVPRGNVAQATGVIEYYTDRDYFQVTVPTSGQLQVRVDVAEFGPNLDSKVELRAATGVLIASIAPTNDLGATLTHNVNAGDYYIVVASHGKYGDVGQYTVTATLPQPAAPPAEQIRITGPAELVPGQTGEFTFSVVSPNGQTLNGARYYLIDWESDGKYDQIEYSTSATIQHTFTEAASTHISVIAVDAVKGSYATASKLVNVVPISLQRDPNNSALTNLVVGLSTGQDYVTLSHSGNQIGINYVILDGRISLRSEYVSAAQVTGTIQVYAQAGDDTVISNLNRGVQFFGGDGNDILVGGSGDDLLDGGAGDDILLGLDGNDILLGGTGNDVLVGGYGVDYLLGDEGDDLLIGDHLTFSTSLATMRKIQSEWTSDKPYMDRIATLTGGTSRLYSTTNFDPAHRLQRGVTVLSDRAIDYLIGGAGDDWFLTEFSRDLVVGLANELKSAT